MNDGLEAATVARAPGLQDLVWMRDGRQFELAVELEIPSEVRERLASLAYRRVRYELRLGLNAADELSVLAETLWLTPEGDESPSPRELFPSVPQDKPLVRPARKHHPAGWRRVVAKQGDTGNDYYHSERTNWNSPFRLGSRRLALANLPEDEDRFPATVWARRTLIEGIRWMALSSEAMRRPAPPGKPNEFQPDGSNLPWAVAQLESSNPAKFRRWVDHIRTVLPDIESVGTCTRPEDRHRYLIVHYGTGLRAPSWTISDGTLRLLALTLLPYLAERDRIYLIEEPENGIHPRGIEAVFQSLSSAYESQILCATHSTVLLPLAKPAQILCFARSPEGATDVVRGDLHPNLQDWTASADLGTLFAMGILG